MDYNVEIKEKLNKLLFLEIDWEKFKKNVNIDEKIKLNTKDAYIPISSKYVADNANDIIKITNLPIYYLIEGMLIALGADRDIKYKVDYIIILNNIKGSEECGKSLVAKSVKEDDLLEAYVLLKGLYEATQNEEYYKKILLVGETIREKDSGFSDILSKDCNYGKKEFPNMAEPYLYNALVLKQKDNYQGAKVEINEYIAKGGEVSKEIENIINDINNISKYEKAVEDLDKEPKKSLKTFLSLVDEFDKNPLLYYYLGVCYRKLQDYDKAIYYLSESLRLESGILEVVNELGLNYACLGNYHEALKYFKKAFEASKELEICTNIVMCYINIGDIKQAKLNLEIAKKINPQDDVVCKLDRMLSD
ncbi:MAG: tetratricopeptide repeat protein [Clostridiales bacterium]|nr:tetratricopeptide repeat protein [Clostridiales bacterium]